MRGEPSAKRTRSGERAMTAENLVGLVLAAGLIVFLVTALVFPERF
jgi:K+-transporting ATPase KdpF subunit